MAIETQIQPRQTWQNIGYGVICLGLAIWGWYDYDVSIPAREAAVAEWTAAEQTRTELENLSRAASLTDEQKVEFRAAEATLNKYTEKPEPPAAYDRPMQLWLYIIGCGVLGVPWFIYAQWKLSRQRFRLDDDGTLHTPQGSFVASSIKSLDLSKWMSKAIAKVEVDDGTLIELDDYKYRYTEDIIGALAQRFEPGKWTSDARPIGDPKSRDTKRELAERAARAQRGDSDEPGSSSDDGHAS